MFQLFIIKWNGLDADLNVVIGRELIIPVILNNKNSNKSEINTSTSTSTETNNNLSSNETKLKKKVLH